MSFGLLSRMFQGMLKVDRKAIAVIYGIQPDNLESWMHHLSMSAIYALTTPGCGTVFGASNPAPTGGRLATTKPAGE